MVVYKKDFSESEIAEIEAVIDKMADDRNFQLSLNEAPRQGGLERKINVSKLPDIERDLRTAVGRFPASIDLHAWLAFNLYEQGRVEESLVHMRKQAELHTQDADWRIAYALHVGTAKKELFNTVAAEIFRMPLTIEQKSRLNQFSAAANAQPRKIEPHPVIKYIDKKLGGALNWIFGLDR